MKLLSKVAAIGALTLIAACSNNDPSALGGGAGGSGALVPGSPSDPRSPAYFQQTVGDRGLFAVDQCRNQIRDCCFMLQKEVVDRMIAIPASETQKRLGAANSESIASTIAAKCG